MMQALKKGTFRWRKKFRYLPSHQQLIDEIGIDWLANRLYHIIYVYFYARLPTLETEIVRVKHWEFMYIIHKTMHFTSIEIIQKEPFELPKYY